MLRRTFVQSIAAGALLLASPALAAKPKRLKPRQINDRLRRIADEVRKLAVVASVDEHLVKKPSVGFDQLPWAHFKLGMNAAELALVEQVNRELLTTMTTLHALPEGGFDNLLHEGFVEGNVEKQIEQHLALQRELIRTQFTVAVPFTLTDVAPKPETVERELHVLKNLEKPVNQIVYPWGRAQNVLISPLGRLGAGYVFSTQQKIELLAAEDPAIDAKAEAAEQSGNQADFDRWVMRERDTHFVKLIRAQRGRIMHLMVGYGHTLTDDVAASNEANPEQISHIVIIMKSIAEAQKAAKAATMRPSLAL